MDIPSPDRYTTTVTVLLGCGLVVAGVWSLFSPASFADLVGFAQHDHFVHDLGAFEVGAGTFLLLALIWADPVITALTAFLVLNTLHAINHFVDLHHGGGMAQAVLISAISVAVTAAVLLRYRQLGRVLGQVRGSHLESLAPMVRQKTVLLTTYRRNGDPGSTPVSIAVDGDRAYVRSFEQALKTKRLRRNPAVQVAASSGLGKPLGQPVDGKLRRLEGGHERRARSVLRRKYPVLHGIIVPMAHRLGRAKTGRTVHFELTVAESGHARPSQ